MCFFFGKTSDELFRGFHGYFWNQIDIEQNFNYQKVTLINAPTFVPIKTRAQFDWQLTPFQLFRNYSKFTTSSHLANNCNTKKTYLNL